MSNDKLSLNEDRIYRPGEAKVYVTYFTNVKTTKWYGAYSTLEDLFEFNHKVVESKEDAKCFSLTVYKSGGKRCKNDVELLSGLVFDFDHLDEASYKRVCSAISGYCYSVYSTFNHMVNGDNDYCFRIVIPFTRAVTKDEYEIIWSFMYSKLGQLPDSSTKDPSRLWFLPSCTSDRMKFAFIDHHEGKIITPDNITMNQKKAESHDTPTGKSPDDIILEGDRHSALLKIAGSLRRARMNASEISETLDRINKNRCKPSLPDQEVKRIASDIGAKPLDSSNNNGNNSPYNGPERRKNSVVRKIVDIYNNAFLFSDERKECYIFSDYKVVPMNTEDFKYQLIRDYANATGDYPNSENINNALNVLKAKARSNKSIYALANRFRNDDINIWLDLCNCQGSIIRVNEKEWKEELVAHPFFKRYPHQKELQKPEENGSFKDILEFLNLSKDKDNEILVLTWLATTLLADIERPILCINGPEGSAKTTAARILKELIDPSVVSFLDVSNSDRELAQVMEQHAVCFFDNLTSFKGWQANFFARAQSGGSFQKRKLYTDSDSIIFNLKKAIIFTGINIPTSQRDVLDRCILVSLDRIPKGKRLEQGDLWKKYQGKKSKILGGLLTTLSKAIKIRKKIKLESMPRLADFARWGAAVAVALGYSQDDFIRAVERNCDYQQEEARNHVIYDPMVDFVVSKGTWTGTMNELLKELTSKLKEGEKSQYWPRTPQHLSRMLGMLKSTLEEDGIAFRKEGKSHRNGRKYLFTYNPPKEDQNSPKDEKDNGDNGNGKKSTNPEEYFNANFQMMDDDEELAASSEDEIPF